MTDREFTQRELFGQEKQQTRRGAPWTEEEIGRMAREYPLAGGKEMARRLGRSLGSVQGHVMRFGLHSLVHRQLQSESHLSGYAGCDDRYFETWSPNMAWMLGYIWADGSIYDTGERGGALKFGCVTDDDYLLFQIKDELESNHKIARNVPGPSGRHQSRLQITSTQLVKSLMSLHGLMPRKTYLDCPFPAVPPEHLPHFARGLLDGDGCVKDGGRRTTIEFLANYTFLCGFRDAVCAAIPVVPPKVTLRRGCTNRLSAIYFAHHDDIVLLARWLYPDGDYICLTRKRKKLEEGAARKIRRKARLTQM